MFAYGLVDDHRGDLKANFTIVINTFRRDVCLLEAVLHWLTCNPFQLRVAWNDVGRQVPDNLLGIVEAARGSLVIDYWSTKNLTNRFLASDVTTDAIFSIDDDLTYTCDELWAAYEVWQSHPWQMVGFAPRILEHDGSYLWDSSYHYWGWNRANAVFITKGGFLHKRYHHAYFSPRFERLRAIVNAHTTGEDLLMSFVCASHPDSQPHNARPVPILAHGVRLLSCSANTKQSLGNLTANRRPGLLKTFFDGFGPVLEFANFEDFYHFDKISHSFINLGQSCGNKFGGVNPLWLLCIRRVWSMRGNYAV
jgi:hypothetical protein